MVTLTFKFNKGKISDTGLTEDMLLTPMREYARKHNISENEYGVFSKDSYDALSLLTMFVTRYTNKHLNYLSFLKEWTLDVDGEKEDCIAELLKAYSKGNIPLMDGLDI